MSRMEDQPAASAAISRTLLQRARASEPGAWESLVAEYRPLVAHWCSTTSTQPADVDDVSQEVFLRVSQALGGFRHDGPGDTFPGWLRTITRNVLVTHLRRRGRQPLATGGSEATARLQELADPHVEVPAGSAGWPSALDMVSLPPGEHLLSRLRR